MAIIGIIGGSGLARLKALKVNRHEVVSTPFGEPSAPFLFGQLHGRDVVFLPRHGSDHSLPPHKVNYRANIRAFGELGITDVIGVTAVGGIGAKMAPGTICLPDQLIDYTYEREHTFFASDLTAVTHIDFTEPYCENLRQRMQQAASIVGVDVLSRATYGATQGPRLETAAEIRRLRQDGCDIVGMTGMPEAALAREADLCYAGISLVVNWAAGLGDGPITMQEIEANLADGMARVVSVLGAVA